MFYKPACANSSARTSARALSRVSSYSAVGFESITIPAPACTYAFPSDMITVRIAMQIIHELEPAPRGLYAGAVGYVDFAGNLDFCIAIRTVIMSKGKAYVQAGAGIVIDSNPTAEYEETRDKARALMTALELAQQGL